MNTRSKMAHPFARGLLLPALLAGVALLAAGCLPSAEDTLGEAPPGVLAEFPFDSGIPAEFASTGTVSTPLIIGAQGGHSGPPSLRIETSGTGAMVQCIQYNLGSLSSIAQWIEYYRLGSGSGITAVTFRVTAIPSGTNLEASVPPVAWDNDGFDLPPNTAAVEWCLASTNSDGSQWIVEIDDVEVY